ncbi:hypothetical protein FB192DRAFT_1270969 [Mucor lusitanicus]|uniref:SH3 domain-containing protein n=1 Tax=Mucor circinelloides f. lusitanicus TaxID=29924 RepID=A0A8H4BQD7_MUCCL|nr:hypothetical protein FB192DRAFT_1270969 [Mucor lusitanicus]
MEEEEEENPLDERVVRLPKREAEDIPPQMRQALEDYATAMAYCREESFSILDDLDALVVRPADRFHMITKTIDKTITKREHKLIDFDRHRVAYMKYSAIQEPSPSEEKNMFKLQTQFDNAAADYDYFNNMLKDELARFLDLSQEFIEPVFRQFYNIQSRVVGGFYGRLHEVIQHNGAIFPTLNMPIEDGFRARLKEFNARQELDQSELFKGGIKPWQRGNTHSRYAKQQQPQQRDIPSISERPSFADRRPSVSERPPINSPRQLPALSPRPSYNARSRSIVANRKELVEALYELNAPQDGDLSFHVGDVIEVLEKSDKTHDWWKGRLGDRTGMFPGKLLTTKVVAQVIHD